jgi:hypothetical protein
MLSDLLVRRSNYSLLKALQAVKAHGINIFTYWSNNMNKQDVIDGFLECLLWSECDDDGNPIDDNYDLEDLSEEALEEAKKDCEGFLDLAKEVLEKADLDDTQIGHDFCLTRNRHGAGFWDRELGEVGEELTKIAHSFGTFALYVGDDEKLYYHG